MSYKNFISKMFVKELAILNEEDNTRVRLQNVAWPSECSADVGPFTVGECKRNLFYKIIGVEPSEDVSLKSSYICDAGLMYEKYHTERLQSLGLLKDTQIKIQFTTDTANKVTITGKMDCVIEDNGERKGIEIKSISAFKAPDVFGNKTKMPLPAVNNLMQAMLYKHWAKNTEDGRRSKIDEVYLMYINRSDNSTFFFRVDLDEQGYAIVTPIDQFGRELPTINLQQKESYDELLMKPGLADQEQGRLAELRVSTSDIFKKFDNVYSSVKSKIVPEPDFKMAYTDKDLELDLKCGRITKKKITTMKKDGEVKSDYKCSYCPYVKKCLSDSGVNMITF